MNSGSSTSSSSRTMASPIGRTGLVAAPRSMSTTQKARTSAPTVRVESQEEAEEDNTPVPDGLVRCSVCKRNFAEDRIEKHQVICFKSKTKKRRVYDSTKSRVVVSINRSSISNKNKLTMNLLRERKQKPT